MQNTAKMTKKAVESIYKIVDTLAASDPEGTRAPYWVIIDPTQNMSCDIHEAAAQFTGIFFSREDAQRYLDGRRYHFSKRAKVYCHSGNFSEKYEDLCKAIVTEK